MLTRFAILAILVALALVSLGGCTVLPVSRAPAAESYATRPSPHGAARFPNWPVPPHEVERLILHGRPQLEQEVGAGAGTTGAEKTTLSFPDDGVVLDVKWKLMDPSRKPWSDRLDGINNSPRKELAAWAIQRLFLEPEDYVVPSTTTYCVPMAKVAEEDRKKGPTLEGSQCQLGVAALWLKDITLELPVLDPERFDRDYVLKPADLTTALGVVSQLELDDQGIYRNVRPGDNLDPSHGVRIEGKTLQFGLTDDEIEDVWERIRDLIEQVDDGDLPVF